MAELISTVKGYLASGLQIADLLTGLREGLLVDLVRTSFDRQVSLRLGQGVEKFRVLDFQRLDLVRR